ncbi:MAG: aminoglycoside phosphotransferase family protein [Cyclobacteriaceae bacterium]|nr:aminoglycoside phosphotransferase family protein [Cyclobacteriaceae bacterium]
MKDVLVNFRIEDTAKCRLYGEGLINDTYIVVTTKGKYILQKLNTNVFLDPEAIASNLELLYQYDTNKLLVPVIRSVNGVIFHIDEKGDYWRLSLFIEEAITFQKIEERYQVDAAARAFASFLNLTALIPEKKIKTVIPDFHNGLSRWNQFERALESASIKRKEIASDAIKRIKNNKYIFEEANELIQNSPLLITHNDTKINNVLIDPLNKVYKNVIDLDTVMQGYLMYDFGDMVRTMANSSNENEQDLTKVYFRIEVFEQLCKGFSDVYSKKLTNDEKSSLIYSGSYMALIMGLRFLTDYLNNDIYYHTSYEQENLNRSINQLKFIDSIFSSNSAIKKLVEFYF